MKNELKKLSLLLSLSFFVVPSFSSSPLIGVKALEENNVATTVKGMKHHNNNVLTFYLTNTDYSGAATYIPGEGYREYNFLTKIEIITKDGTSQTIGEATDGEQIYYQMWGQENTFSISLKQEKYDNLSQVVIPQGTTFPSMEYTGYRSFDGSLSKEKGTLKKGFETERDITYAFQGKEDLSTTGSLYSLGNISLSKFTYGQGDVDKGKPDLFFYSEDANWPSAPIDLKSDEEIFQYYNTYANKDFSHLAGSLNYLDKIKLDGKSLRELGTPSLQKICYLTVWHSITISAPTYQGGNDLNTVEVEEGCELPAFSTDPYESPYYIVDKTTVFGRTGDSFQKVENIQNDAHQIEDNVLSWDTDDNSHYVLRIPLQMTGAFMDMGSLEEKYGDKISFNGKTLTEINQSNKQASAHYEFVGNRYHLILTLNQDYEGILNRDLSFAGNVVTLEKGLLTPGGIPLNATYRIHQFKGGSVTDIQNDIDSYGAISVNAVTSYIPTDLAKNDMFIYITFDQEITGSPVYYVTSPRSFCEVNVKKSNTPEYTFFEQNSFDAFVYGGYKSAVLEKLLINDEPICRWMASDNTPSFPVSVMGHYGQAANNVFSLSFSHGGSLNQPMAKMAKEGTLKLSFLPGFLFPSGNAIQERQDFVYQQNAWKEQSQEGAFSVYYDGEKVEEGATIDSAFAPSLDQISVMGISGYTIEETAEDALVTTYAIKRGEETLLTFHVRYTEQPLLTPTKQNSFPVGWVIGGGVAVLLIAGGITGLLLGRKRRKAK